MAIIDRLQGFSIGVAVKPPCTVASTGNLTLSSSQVIDGIAVGSCERVLVRAQTNAKENGIYEAGEATWRRTADWDGRKDAIPGSLVYVDRGNTFSRVFFVANSSSTAISIDIGATGDDVSWSQVTPSVTDVSAGTVQTVGSTIDRALDARFADIVNLKDFIPVADFGSTTASVSTGIQDALDTATAGDLVLAPRGTYILGSTGLFFSKADVTLECAMGAVFVLSTDTTMVSVTASGVAFVGGVWDGNNAATGTKRQMNITGAGAHLERMVIKDTVTRNVNIYGVSDCVITKCRITGGPTPIFVEASTVANARNTLIEGNYLVASSGTDNDGVEIHGTNTGQDVTGSRVVNNYIEVDSTAGFGIEIGAFGGNTPTGVIASNNRIKALRASFGGISFGSVDNSVIAGNIYDSNGQIATIGGVEGVGLRRCTITGNVVVGSSVVNRGITLNGAGDVEDNVVSNNVVDGFSNAANDDYGIVLSCDTTGTGKRNIFSNNIIRMASTSSGIFYQGITIKENNPNAVVSDNVISGNIVFGNNDTSCRGIQIDAGNSGNDRSSVVNNVVIDTASGILDFGNNTLISGNRFQNVTTEYTESGSSSIVNKVDFANLAMTFGKLGVSNSVGSSVAGNIVRKVELFGSTGNSLGFLPVYDTISTA